jgi:ComEC/Rec2-related protein
MWSKPNVSPQGGQLPQILHWWYQRIHQISTFPLILLSSAWLSGIVLAAAWQLPPIIPLGIAIAAIIPALYYWSHRSRRLLFLSLCLLCAGAWRYTIAQPAYDPQSVVHAIGPAVVDINGIVAAEPRLSAHARLLTIQVTEISPKDSYDWQPLHGTIEVISHGTLLEDPYGANYGDSVTLYGKLLAPSSQTPTAFQAVMSFPGISISSGSGNPVLTQLYHLRVHCAAILTRSLPQPLAALLIAIVLGLRTPALTTLAFAFNVTGTAHLIVPSGFKVTIVASLITNSTRWLSQSRLTKYLPGQRYKAGAWLQTLLVISGIALYTVLSGAGAAALRAGIMGSLLVIAPRLQRTYNVYTALAFTAILMSLQDPTILWDTGFLLSFLGTLGIVLFTPTLQRYLHFCEILPGGHIVAENAAVTLAAQLATLPIFALTFQQISFIAPIANLLTVPLLGILVTLGLVICLAGFIALPLAQLFGKIAWPLLWYMSQTITSCAALPYAYMHVEQMSSMLSWLYYGLLTLSVLVLCTYYERYTYRAGKPITTVTQHRGGASHHTRFQRWQQHKVLRYSTYIGGTILLIAITASVSQVSQYTATNSDTTIAFLNIGPVGKTAQGEAILIRSADGAVVLIDGGPDASSLAETLDSRFPPWQRSINLAVLTIPQTAHIVGLQDAITRYNVAAVIDTGMQHPNTTYIRWRRTIDEQHLSYTTVGQGQTISVGTRLRLEILWPPLHLLHKGNSEILDNAMILRLVTPSLRVLLLGATAQSRYALTELLQQIPAIKRQAEIVQIVGGTKQILTPECIDVIRAAHPSLLVVTPSTQHSTKSAQNTQTTKQATSSQTPMESETLLIPGLHEIQTSQTGGLTINVTAQSWTIHAP